MSDQSDQSEHPRRIPTTRGRAQILARERALFVYPYKTLDGLTAWRVARVIGWNKFQIDEKRCSNENSAYMHAARIASGETDFCVDAYVDDVRLSR